LYNRFTEKAEKSIPDYPADTIQKPNGEIIVKQMPAIKTTGKGGKPAREPRDPAQEFEDSMHRTKDGKLAIPVAAIIGVCKEVAGYFGISKKAIEDGITILNYVQSQDGRCKVIPLTKHSIPKLHRSVGKIGPWSARVPHTIIRALIEDWECRVVISFNPDIISIQNVSNILAHAGNRGMLSWTSGGYGKFTPENVPVSKKKAA